MEQHKHYKPSTTFMYYVYFLKSKKYNENYVGSTDDLRRRFSEHNKGIQQSTKRYKPWSLVYYEAYQSEKDARERESRLKHHGNAIRELKKRIQNSMKVVLGKNKNGFTSLELLMVMGLIAILAVGSISLWRNNKNRIAFEETKKNVLLALEKARSRAETGFQNDPNSKCYGVRRDGGNKIIISERCGTDCDIDCGDSIDVYLPASVNDFSVKFRRIDAWADTDTDITFPTNTAKISVKHDGRIIEN